jgi:hypothetical protein
MKTVKIRIDASWNEIYEVLNNVHNWSIWNGTIQEISDTEKRDEFSVRVNLLGWIHCRVKEQNSQEKRFGYELYGKGNRETGILRLVTESSDGSMIEYQVKHEGWVKMITALGSATSWRVGRLKEFCENGTVVDPFGWGMAR